MPQITDKDREAARIDGDILRKVRVIAGANGWGVSETIERAMRASVERMYAKALAKMNHNGRRP